MGELRRYGDTEGLSVEHDASRWEAEPHQVIVCGLGVEQQACFRGPALAAAKATVVDSEHRRRQPAQAVEDDRAVGDVARASVQVQDAWPLMPRIGSVDQPAVQPHAILSRKRLIAELERLFVRCPAAPRVAVGPVDPAILEHPIET